MVNLGISWFIFHILCFPEIKELRQYEYFQKVEVSLLRSSTSFVQRVKVNTNFLSVKNSLTQERSLCYFVTVCPKGVLIRLYILLSFHF